MTVISGEKFNLALISAERISLHEECDELRYRSLIRRFKTERVLYNPLIVGKYGRQFILIDGANRYEALKKLGCRSVLCQIVDYKKPDVILKSWRHFVYRLTLESLANFFKSKKLEFRKAALKNVSRFGKNNIFFSDKKGNALYVKLNHKLKRALSIISTVTKFYEARYAYDRIDPDIDVRKIKDIVPAGSGLLVVYPQFKKNHIAQIAGLKQKLPAGISRHILPNRVLHIKYDIASFKNNLRKGDDVLRNLIEQKVSEKKVRVYKEPIIIFDE